MCIIIMEGVRPSLNHSWTHSLHYYNNFYVNEKAHYYQEKKIINCCIQKKKIIQATAPIWNFKKKAKKKYLGKLRMKECAQKFFLLGRSWNNNQMQIAPVIRSFFQDYDDDDLPRDTPHGRGKVIEKNKVWRKHDK